MYDKKKKYPVTSATIEYRSNIVPEVNRMYDKSYSQSVSQPHLCCVFHTVNLPK